MQVESGQLAALLAVLREGSFDRAAGVLHVTPSAVSQRIKLLEQRLGAVLVVRGVPCRPTPRGREVYKHALQLEVLERELLAALPGAGAAQTPEAPMSIAANADSLATWLVPALVQAASRPAPGWRWWWTTRTTRRSGCARAGCWGRSPPRPSRCRAAGCSRWG